MTVSALPKVAFVCTRNSCRSQMAEAIARLHYPDIIEPYSAGTEPGEDIDPAAAKIIKDLYGVDMRGLQRAKPLSELPPVDVVVTMGCGVSCPTLSVKERLDWGLDDPIGGPHEGYVECVKAIEEKLGALVEHIAGHSVDEGPERTGR